MIPTVVIYQLLPNNFEVEVRIAFDKKDLSNRLKQSLHKELETESGKTEIEAVNINAPAGMTMKGMNNKGTTVILLR